LKWPVVSDFLKFLFLLIFLAGCASHTRKSDFQERALKAKECDYFLVILVDAKHLNYANNRAFFRSVIKHPSNGSKDGTVGHAWFYLHGNVAGQPFNLEGGHSGELGRRQPKYFDGIMNYIDYGYANPTRIEKTCPLFEPNPVKYLWETQRDGFFQKGNGGHRPSYAAKIALTADQFQRILDFIWEYSYSQYSITDQQCSQYVTQIAALVGWYLDDKITMNIQPVFKLRGRTLRMWEDSKYATITFSSPDKLERSLRKSVKGGRAEPALRWYQNLSG
jgi:hypothetical protein